MHSAHDIDLMVPLQIFFTTKLMHNKTDPAWVEHCVDVSTQKAGISPDLYLIHDPNGGPEVRAAMWEGCCRVKDKGKVKSIGVSNFGVKHLEDLLAGKPKYVPAVNQIVRSLTSLTSLRHLISLTSQGDRTSTPS